MKPLKIEMNNFGSYDHEVIDFEEREIQSGVFLITGDTGTGKSLIFDAMVFALYGEASGSSKDYEELISRKQDQNPEVEMRVEFTFMHNKEKYRIKRFVTRKLGDDGKAEKDINADLDREEMEEGKAVWKQQLNGSNRWKKVTTKIEDITNLNKSQFCQIVMLAQGEFREFLSANSKERSDILRKLFDFSMYKRFEDIISEANTRLNKTKQDSEILITSVMTKRFQQPEAAEEFEEGAWIPTSPNLLANLDRLVVMDEEVVEEKEKEKKTATGELEKKQKIYTVAEQQNRQLDNLKNKKQECRAKLQERRVYRERKVKADRVEQLVQEVLPFVVKYREEERRYTELLEDIERLRKENGEKKAAWEKADAEYGTASEARTPERKKMEDEKKAISDSLPKYEEKDRKQKEYDQKERELNKAREALEAKQKDKDKHETWLKNEAKSEAERLNGSADRVKALQEDLDGKRGKNTGLFGKDGLQSRVHTILEEEKKCEKLSGEAQTTLTEAKKLSDIFKDLYDRYLLGQAGVLADELRNELEQKGHAECPVCGTAFALGDETHFAEMAADCPKKEDVDKAEEAWKKQDKVREEKQKSLELQKEKLERDRQDAVRDCKTLLEIETTWEELKDPEYLQGYADQLGKEIRKLEEELKQAGADAGKEAELQKQIEEAEKQVEDLGKEIIQKDAQIRIDKNNLDNLGGEIEKLKADLTFENAEAANKAISGLTEKIKEIDDELKKLQDEATRAKGDFDSNAGALEEKEKDAPKEKQQKEEAGERMVQALNRHGLSSPEEMDAALGEMEDPKAWLKAEKKELENYYSKVTTLVGQMKDQQKNTRGMLYQDLTALQADVKAREEAVEEIDKELDSLKGIRQNHKDVRNEVKTAIDSVAEIQYAAELLAKLAAVAGSTNAENGKLSFERFVMGEKFRKVLVKANERLRPMSRNLRGGEIQLAHKAEGGKKNAVVGLDLICKRKTHEENASQLSGGEQFITSMALALGLSDAVLSDAGNMGIDTLFIDEGFGTLDPEVLDAVVNVLSDLTGGEQKRLVGIITHVEGLERQLGGCPSLKVTYSDATGSKVGQ